jgi:hypothetical protein
MKKKLFALLPVILLASSLAAQPVTLKHLSDATFIRGGAGSVQMQGYLYSLGFYNTIHKINLSTGVTDQLGKELFTDVRFFFGVSNRLFIIRKNNSMIEIDITTGSFHEVLPALSWQFISRVIPVGRNLYTVNQGTLYHNPGIRPEPAKALGTPSFFDIDNLMWTETTLHALVGTSLYKIDLQTGKWTQVKKDKAFRAFKTGAVIGDKLYYVEQKGGLVEMNMTSGESKVLDETQFLMPVMMFQDSGKLYYLNGDYKLFEILIK